MESQPELTEGAKDPGSVPERLNWKQACRDDTRVAQALYAGEAIEEMPELSDAGLLDEFCVFLEDLGLMQAFEQRSLPGAKRMLVPTVQFVLLYLLTVLVGGQSMPELPRVLISSLGLMELVGFNAHQCENGLTKRGDAQRQPKKKQGPISAQCLADTISKLKEEELERLFNQMLQVLARRGLFTGQLVVALDGSKLPTPQSYEGCGKLKQTRKVQVKGQKEAATEAYYVSGGKVWVRISVQTRLPLAMKVVKIQQYEGRWLIPRLPQAQRNLGEQAHLETIVIDRGYRDAADLWRVQQKGLLFVIVGKANMTVVGHAPGLAKGERAVVRERIVGHGRGKTATRERLRTELVGMAALTSSASDGEAEHTRLAHRRDYTGQPINAVVVRRWEKRVPKGAGTVYVTNGQLSDPFRIFDTYDWRRVIENGICKEGKHPWHLLPFPKRTQAAVVMQCFFTLLVRGLCSAFRLGQAQGAATSPSSTEGVPSLSSALLAGEGTARWRQR